MTTPLKNIGLGTAVAVAIALILIQNIGGVSTWKFVLAALGLVLWFAAERR